MKIGQTINRWDLFRTLGGTLGGLGGPLGEDFPTQAVFLYK